MDTAGGAAYTEQMMAAPPAWELKKKGVCCLPRLTRPDCLSCDVKLSPQCSRLLVTIISMNCLNVSSMTAQGNAFHK